MITTSKSCSWKFPEESFNSVRNTGLDYSLECNFCLNVFRMRSLWRPKISFPIFLKLTWSFVIQWIKYSFYFTLDSNLLYYHFRLFSILGWFVPTMSSVCTIWASRSPIWRPSMPTGSWKWFPLQMCELFLHIRQGAFHAVRAGVKLTLLTGGSMSRMSQGSFNSIKSSYVDEEETRPAEQGEKSP